jgi:HlyD family secretion protein
MARFAACLMSRHGGTGPRSCRPHSAVTTSVALTVDKGAPRIATTAPPADSPPPSAAHQPAATVAPAAVPEAVAPRHRARWIFGGLAVLGLGALSWRYLPTLILGPVITATPLVRTDLVQTLVASGHIASRFRSEISSQTTGVVTRIPVAEGATVRAGDTLVLLDDAESQSLVVEAQGAVQQATAQLRQLRELTLPAAEQVLVQATAARIEAERALERNLARLGLDTPASQEDARTALDIAQAKERAAALTVSTDRPNGSTTALLNAQLAQAKAASTAASTRRRYRAIVAPMAGVLIARSVEVGDVAQPGKLLMLLSPSGDMDVVVQIDEKQLGLLAVGQPALASADAFPSERFDAAVRFINPGIDLLRASVEVRLRIPEPPPGLRQDMTVSVDIETARRRQTLVVNTEDIHDRDTAAPWLLVVRNGRIARQPVRVGLSSGGQSELLDGVLVGETVVPLSAGALSIGRRIRLQPHAPNAP